MNPSDHFESPCFQRLLSLSRGKTSQILANGRASVTRTNYFRLEQSSAENSAVGSKRVDFFQRNRSRYTFRIFHIGNNRPRLKFESNLRRFSSCVISRSRFLCRQLPWLKFCHRRNACISNITLTLIQWFKLPIQLRNIPVYTLDKHVTRRSSCHIASTLFVYKNDSLQTMWNAWSEKKKGKERKSGGTGEESIFRANFCVIKSSATMIYFERTDRLKLSLKYRTRVYWIVSNKYNSGCSSPANSWQTATTLRLDYWIEGSHD